MATDNRPPKIETPQIPDPDRLTSQLYSLPEIVGRLGLSIANAQKALDLNYVENLGRIIEMVEQIIKPAMLADEKNEGVATMAGIISALAPSRYQFTETTIDFSADLAESFDAAVSGSLGAGFGAVNVSASLSAAFGYDYRAAARITSVLQAYPTDKAIMDKLLARAKEIRGDKLSLPPKKIYDARVLELNEEIARKITGLETATQPAQAPAERAKKLAQEAQTAAVAVSKATTDQAAVTRLREAADILRAAGSALIEAANKTLDDTFAGEAQALAQKAQAAINTAYEAKTQKAAGEAALALKEGEGGADKIIALAEKIYLTPPNIVTRPANRALVLAERAAMEADAVAGNVDAEKGAQAVLAATLLSAAIHAADQAAKRTVDSDLIKESETYQTDANALIQAACAATDANGTDTAATNLKRQKGGALWYAAFASKLIDQKADRVTNYVKNAVTLAEEAAAKATEVKALSGTDAEDKAKNLLSETIKLLPNAVLSTLNAACNTFDETKLKGIITLADSVATLITETKTLVEDTGSTLAKLKTGAGKIKTKTDAIIKGASELQPSET